MRERDKILFALATIVGSIAVVVQANAWDWPWASKPAPYPRTQQQADQFDRWNNAKDTSTPQFRRDEEAVMDGMGFVPTYKNQQQIDQSCKYVQDMRRKAGISDYNRDHDMIYRDGRTGVINRC